MKISIITVVFNNIDFIEDCINSVLSQNHDDLEYIIIDGGSSDGTLQKINEHANKISRIVSEPDNGIYDAMNKGIALATGEIIGILNADDFYTSADVLSSVNKVFADSSIGACYSDVEYVRRENVRRVVRRWHSGVFDRNRFFYGWSPPHPTFFARRELFQKFGGYNTSLKISADYEMMLRLLFVNQVKCHYLSKIIIRMREGGISNRSVLNRLRANKEDRMAWEINFIRPRAYTLSLKPLRKLAQFF